MLVEYLECRHVLELYHSRIDYISEIAVVSSII